MSGCDKGKSLYNYKLIDNFNIHVHVHVLNNLMKVTGSVMSIIQWGGL